jgi:hypothetical protein
VAWLSTRSLLDFRAAPGLAGRRRTVGHFCCLSFVTCCRLEPLIIPRQQHLELHSTGRISVDHHLDRVVLHRIGNSLHAQADIVRRHVQCRGVEVIERRRLDNVTRFLDDDAPSAVPGSNRSSRANWRRRRAYRRRRSWRGGRKATPTRWVSLRANITCATECRFGPASPTYRRCSAERPFYRAQGFLL